MIFHNHPLSFCDNQSWLKQQLLQKLFLMLYILLQWEHLLLCGFDLPLTSVVEYNHGILMDREFYKGM